MAITNCLPLLPGFPDISIMPRNPFRSSVSLVNLDTTRNRFILVVLVAALIFVIGSWSSFSSSLKTHSIMSDGLTVEGFSY